MATDFPDDTSLRVSRRLDAAAARVWDAFVSPQQMATWMWAGWGSDTVAEADVRVGGRYSVYTTAPEMVDGWPTDRWGFLGYYTQIVEPERLVYTIHWDGPVGYNQTDDVVADEFVIVTITEADGASDVVMWHCGIPADGISAPEHAKGIEVMFDVLEGLLAE